jgi:negative regulator of flagellin synthesis FlgM
MRVNLNGLVAGQIASEKDAKKVSGENRALSQGISQDRTTLSSDTVAVSSLASQAMETAPIRQDRVDSLRQAIEQGQYKLEPDKIAEAILQEYGN